MAATILGGGSVHTATVPVTVTPSGIACTCELYLGPAPGTKTATSLPVAFTSTGASQNVACQVTMPTASADYKVYMDIKAGTILLGEFVATDDVIIPGVTVSQPVWS